MSIGEFVSIIVVFAHLISIFFIFDVEDSGDAASIYMNLSFLLVCRNSLVTFVMGILFEIALFWHK